MSLARALVERLDAPFSRLSPRAAPATAVGLVVVYGLVLAVAKWVPRYDCAVVLVAAAAFRALDVAPPRSRERALFACSAVLLCAFLVHLWTLGYEGRNAVFGGILPWSDSHDFANDALRLAHGERFTEVSSKRPLYSTALAALVRLSGGSLRMPLFVCAIAGAAAMTLAAREVWRTHGWRSALLVWLVLLFFERRWTGFVQTEHAGMPLGAVGFALAWRADSVAAIDLPRARRLLAAGLFATTLALVARAGAFFVLPALAIWGARTLTGGGDRRAALRYLGLTIVVGVAAVSVHEIVLKTVGSGVTFSDYPGILYGLVHGEDYTFLARQHPALDAMPIAERVPTAWSIVLGDIGAHPGSLVLGLAHSGADLFVSPDGMFSYVWTNPDDHVLENGALVRAVGPVRLWVRTLGLYSFVNAIVMGALAAGFVIAVIVAIVKTFRRRDPRESMLRAAIVGVVASAPFTPPWITSGMQVQTATLAFVAALPAVVLLGRRRDEPAPARDALPWAAPAFAAAALAMVVWLRVWPAATPAASCTESDARVAPWLIVEQDEIEVAPERMLSFRAKGLPDLTTSTEFLAKHNGELTRSIEPYLHEGTVFGSGYDACARRLAILVDERGVLGARRGWCVLETTRLEHEAVVHVDAALCPP